MLQKILLTNINLHFFIVIGFRGCKRTEEKRKFAIHSPPLTIVMIILILIIIIMIMIVNHQ